MVSDKPRTTEEVFGHHMQAIVARDLDAILEDYTEESILDVNLAPGPVRGLAGLRASFAGILELFTPEVISTFKVARQDVEGEVVYLLWSAGATIPAGSDTFVIRNGKIVVQTAYVQMGQGS